MSAPVELGLIEGFYGRSWSWEARADTMRFLRPHGYGFYLYAPKADAHLRRRWREPHPAADAEALAVFSAACRGEGVRFGVGLSPYELFLNFDDAAKAALDDKLCALDDLGLDDLAILFDDMRGDLPDLAERQAEIIGWAAERTRASRLIVCPSYYSDDPVLDRVFGQRPERYLEMLGERLDPAVEVFWTGEEVCSREIGPGHLDRVAEQIGRKPFLWDNYPVNDGPRMSQHLHLRGFTGRPSAALSGRVAAHGVNPALQPVLTWAPALTLAMAYEQGDAYAYGEAFLAAAVQAWGEELALRVQADLLSLQDAGLERLGERRATLRERYAAFDHAAAREIVDWLDGGYAITPDEMQTS